MHQTPIVGFSTNVYDNPGNLEVLVEQILTKFRAIEIELEDEAAVRVFSSTDSEYRKLTKTLRGSLEKSATFTSVHAPYLHISTDLASIDDVVRKAAVKKTLASIRFCAEIGGDRITCHPGFITKGVPLKDSVAQLRRSLHELKAEADPAGVQICVENMGKGRPKYLVLSSEEHVALAKETGTFVTLDLVHVATWNLDAQWLKNEIATYAPVTRNVHMNDMPDGQHRHVPIGTGVLPLGLMISELMKHGYSGPFMVDEFARPIAPEDYFARSVDFAERIEHAHIQ